MNSDTVTLRYNFGLLKSHDTGWGGIESLHDRLHGSICDDYEVIKNRADGDVKWSLYGANFLTKKYSMEEAKRTVNFVGEYYSSYINNCIELNSRLDITGNIWIEEKLKKEREEWLEGMPESIKSLWIKAGEKLDHYNIGPFRESLNEEFADKSLRILVLLEWFGSGAGPWSGHPDYEIAAEEMLLEYDTQDIVSAIKLRDLTGRQKEGAARLFGGWSYSKRRPTEYDQIPEAIKTLLWNHVKSTDDEDKLGRAKRAFNK